jgi:hypothetical protein
VAFEVAPQQGGLWRVYVPAQDARTQGESAPVMVQVLSLVTATPKSARVPRNGSVVVRAWARPAVAGQRVALQLLKGEKWKTVATATVNGRGRARLVADAPNDKGRYSYRVVAVERGGVGANTSTEIPIRVTR